MGQLGMGVMLNLLGGNQKTIECLKASIGKTIKSLTLDEGGHDELRFEFTDGTKLSIWDDGQSCCESRYMTTSDELSDYIGAVIMDYQIKSADSPDDNDWGCHDIEFFEVITDKGPFQMVNHNEHNGYYGGFSVSAKD